jgi:hypothetical protein
MNTKETEQLQTLLDNRDIIFAEYDANRNNMDFELMMIDRKTTILGDSSGIFTNNNNLMNSLMGLLDDGLNIMSIAFSEYGSEKHPGVYELSWENGYPVNRYYIANTGTGTVAKTEFNSTNYMKFVDWVSGDDINFNEDPSSNRNVYMSIDIWDSTSIPTSQQIKNYYLFYENFPGLQELSTPLKSFIDANKG